MDKCILACQPLADMPNNPRFSPKPRIVEIVAFPGVQILDVAGPLQAFTCANDYASKSGAPRPYAARVVAPGRGQVTASAGLILSAARLPSPRAPLDTLIVAGGPDVHTIRANKKLIAWVRSRAQSARRVTSVCTGAFLLAVAG